MACNFTLASKTIIKENPHLQSGIDIDPDVDNVRCLLCYGVCRREGKGTGFVVGRGKGGGVCSGEGNDRIFQGVRCREGKGLSLLPGLV